MTGGRRVVVSVIGTVTGLVLLLVVKSGPAPKVGATGQTGSGRPGTGRTSPGATGPAATPPPAASGLSDGTFTGSTADTRYGPVRVRLTVAGGRITAVKAVRLPDSNPRDVEINSFAVPVLTQEVLAAQSADIQFVSGATFTSDGYLRSLQSALDKAKR